MMHQSNQQQPPLLFMNATSTLKKNKIKWLILPIKKMPKFECKKKMTLEMTLTY